MTPRPSAHAKYQLRIAELERALAREERVSKALREVGSALGSTLVLDDLLELILDKLTDLLEADRATLYLLEDASSELVSRIVVGSRVRNIRVKVGHGIAGAVAETGAPIRVADAYTDPRFEREWDTLTGYRTRSILAVPLKNHLGRTIGVIQVLNKKPEGTCDLHADKKGAAEREFNSEDEDILSALSTQAAVAIDNSRLFLSLIEKNNELLDAKEQLERGVRDLSLLFELERAMARAESVDDLAQAALKEITLACKAKGAALLLAEEDSGDLVEYVLDIRRPEQLIRLGVKSGEGCLAAMMGSPVLLHLPQLSEHPAFSARVEGAFPFHIEEAVINALEGDGRPLGAMGVFSKEDGQSFSDEDIALLKLVSANVATAVRLFRASQAREYGQRLTTIGSLLSSIIHDFKTPMTVISGYVQLMEAADDKNQRASYSEAVLKQFDLLTSMQREVLEFARGDRRVFARKVYLHKFFADLSAQLRLEFEHAPVELVLDVDSKIVARFDEGRLARAIHNLARNAVEAMGARGGVLSISAKKEPSSRERAGQGVKPPAKGALSAAQKAKAASGAGKANAEITAGKKKSRAEATLKVPNGVGVKAAEQFDLVICVSDTGPGVPKEIEDRLFQSFVTAAKQGGTGLGLAIVKKIVEEHEGSVEMQSSKRGAAFTLRLPLEGPSTDQKAERPLSSPRRSFGKTTSPD